MNYRNVHSQVPEALSEERQVLLKDFIRTFLPPAKTLRQGTANELHFVWRTLDRIFVQRFGYNLARTHILDACKELGYRMKAMQADYDPETKTERPSSEGETYSGTEGYFQNEAHYIFLNVDPATVRVLKRTTAQLPKNTRLDKEIDAGVMIERLRSFAIRTL